MVARNYLINERPDVILNIIDGTNLERNLYLTTQLVELGIPVVIAINMMDIVKKNGDKINTEELSRQLNCKIIEISALKGTGIMEAAEAAIEAAASTKTVPQHSFSGSVEHAIAHIEEAAVHNMPEEQQRWYAIKIFERDDKVMADLKISDAVMAHIEQDIKAAELEMDDDSESIITNERYIYIASIIKACYKKKNAGKLTTSDKIDKVVTNRWLGLPIFAVIMFLVYYISMVTVGSAATDWANDGLFGDGWHLFGIGSSATADAEDEYGDTDAIIEGFLAKAEEEGIDVSAANDALDSEADGYDYEKAVKEVKAVEKKADFKSFTYTLEDEETLETTDETGKIADLDTALKAYEKYEGGVDPANYGVWVPGIPVLVGNGLEKVGAADWLSGLINDGIVAGVGAVLGFVPQMLVLFLLLAFLEACGYMARIAFVLDRIFRKFGLSGKSFIPMLIGTGCGIPGIMASRTIENERDRRMTIMTTTFIPCGAKVPFIAMIAGAIFGGSAWVSTSAYFIGMAAIICSGIMLKKTEMFSGDPAPFVMELPAYHMPTLGWGNWQAVVASITGLVAKENIVGTLGILYGGGDGTVYQNIAAAFTGITAYSFLVFNLLCAPCFAAIGAIKREMNSRKWTWFAIGYQCGFAYLIALMVNQFGNIFVGKLNVIGLIFAIAALALIVYMLVRPYKEATKLTAKVRTE